MSSDDTEDRNDWLLTYADTITLLLALFVIIMSFSKINVANFEVAANAITREISKRDERSPLSELSIVLQDIVYNMEADQVVHVKKDNNGLIINMAAHAFFTPGTAHIRPKALPVLAEMREVLKRPRYDFYMLEVNGHTDDSLLASKGEFSSNWQLSAAQAASVVVFLHNGGVSPLRLKVVGMADSEPKQPNRNTIGEAIPENQAVNRRIEVLIKPMNVHQREEFAQRNIVDEDVKSVTLSIAQ